MTDLTRTSKRLAFLLRHNPDFVDARGWASTKSVLSTLKISLGELETIVSTDSKGRYQLEWNRIRAVQGHSIPVDLGLEPQTPPDVLWHGTVWKNMSSIMKNGLSSQTREHVHLSADYDTASAVGSRRGEPVILSVNAKEASEDGVVFHQSRNGVWLADAVPAKYLSVHS